MIKKLILTVVMIWVIKISTIELTELDLNSSIETVDIPADEAPFMLLRGEDIPLHSAHGEYVCPFGACGKRFLRKGHLERHIRVHTGESPYKCIYDRCSRAFKQKIQLQNHLRTHTGEKNLVCTICKKQFTDTGHLSRHKKEVHKKATLLLCTQTGCPKVFARQEALTIHMLVHTGERPHPCGHQGCSKSFKQKAHRDKHMKTCKKMKQLIKE